MLFQHFESKLIQCHDIESVLFQHYVPAGKIFKNCPELLPFPGVLFHLMSFSSEAYAVIKRSCDMVC